MLDRSRNCKTPPMRCFFTPLYTPGYNHGSGWHKVLELPKAFAVTVEDKVGQEIELINVLGEKWPVILTSSNGTVALGKGWRAFVDSHELEEYHFLVFRSFDSHFRVEVYNRLCVEKFSSVVRFLKPLDESNWIHRLVLPSCISARAADKVGQEAMLENALGEQWRVRFSSYNGGVAFDKGWKEFAKYHNLQEYDLLVFKGFNNGSLFKVEVYSGRTNCEKSSRASLVRAQQEGHIRGKRKIGTCFEQVNRTSRGKAVAEVSSKGSRTESPDGPFGPYTCSAVTRGEELVLPGELPSLNNGRFTLMDEEGRLWPASYLLGTWRLSCSWAKFAALNGVRAGDRFSFAAYDERPLTFKITVLRRST